MSSSKWIWNGKLIPHDDAKIHVGSSALHFGPNAFEGIRCYGFTSGRSVFFRLREHIERLLASAHSLHLEIPFSPEELERACIETVLANGHSNAYVRPLIFPGSGALGFGRSSGFAECYILSFPWQNEHVERSQKQGIRLHVASVIRTQAHPLMSKCKISANYAAGLLAIYEARKAGCDDALLLDAAGSVAEASTANVFAVWGNRIATPPLHLPILAGITRDTLLVLAGELGMDVNEATFDVQTLASADEIFIAGTTCEVTPVCYVDGRKVGDGVPGPITTKLLTALQEAVRGVGPDRGWLTPAHRINRASTLD